jgi:mobilome CxxCx(11)CxxC protein
MAMPATIDPRNEEIWNRATNAFGTSAIFERRARRYKRLNRFLTFFGLLVPVVIGSIAAAHLLENVSLEKVIYWTGALGVLQAAVFLWSVVANWPESQEYSSAANANNLRLSSQWHALAVQSIKPPTDFDTKYAELKATDDAQIGNDTRRDISSFEKVWGMRAGLLQFQRTCSKCHVVPESMKMPFWPGKRCERCGGEKINGGSQNAQNTQHAR